jgi:5-methylcytosine-specific restriction endonuclease McrA
MEVYKMSTVRPKNPHRPTREQRDAFAAIVREKIGESGMSVRQWAYSRPAYAYRDPAAAVRPWLDATSVPPTSKIRAAAEFIGVPEEVVARTLYGCESQAEATADVRRRARAASNAAKKKKYRHDPGFRKRNAERDKIRKIAKDIRALIDYHEDPTLHTARGVFERERQLMKFALPPAEYREWMAERKRRNLMACKRRANAALAERLRPQREARRKALKQIKRAREDMRVIQKQLRWIDRQIAAWSTPWGRDGYDNQTEWYKSGNRDAYDYMRNKWQVVCSRRHAKKRMAGGSGITIEQWIGIKRSWGNRCAYCGAEPENDGHRARSLEIEHIVPLPIGPDEPWNVVPACKTCNTSKAGKELLEWAHGKGINLPSRAVDAYRRSMERIGLCQEATTSPAPTNLASAPAHVRARLA